KESNASHETDYVRFSAVNIATRCSRSGSLSTLLSLLKTIVARSLGLNAGQRGSFPVLGSPFRANAIHESLTLSARSCASGLLEVNRDVLMLSKANGISMVCGDFNLPPSTGDSQRK